MVCCLFSPRVRARDVVGFFNLAGRQPGQMDKDCGWKRPPALVVSRHQEQVSGEESPNVASANGDRPDRVERANLQFRLIRKQTTALLNAAVNMAQVERANGKSASTDARPWWEPRRRGSPALGRHEPFTGGKRAVSRPIGPARVALRSLARPAPPRWYEVRVPSLARDALPAAWVCSCRWPISGSGTKRLEREGFGPVRVRVGRLAAPELVCAIPPRPREPEMPAPASSRSAERTSPWRSA